MRLVVEGLPVARFERKREMTGAGIVAGDLIGCDRLLDQCECVQGGLVEGPTSFAESAQQGGRAELEAWVHHATVAAARPRSERVLLEERDGAAVPGHSSRGHHAGVSATHDHDIDVGWKPRHLPLPRAGEGQGGGIPPPVRLLAISRSEGGGGYSSTFTPCQNAT